MPNGMTTPTVFRELAHRANDGPEVARLWSQLGNRLAVTVSDSRSGAQFSSAPRTTTHSTSSTTSTRTLPSWLDTRDTEVRMDQTHSAEAALPTIRGDPDVSAAAHGWRSRALRVAFCARPDHGSAKAGRC
jgi:hypothetical protein